MERHTVVDLMVKLKLRGMRAAYDEIITQAGKRGHAPEREVGDLLAAQLADVKSRATAYRMGNAKFPVLKTLTEFDLTASPANAAMVRNLHQGFLSRSRRRSCGSERARSSGDAGLSQAQVDMTSPHRFGPS